MRKPTLIPDDARHGLAPGLWRFIGRPLATIAGAILLAVVLVHGESWAILQGPLLLSDNAVAVSAIAGCSPKQGANDWALPVAMLH